MHRATAFAFDLLAGKPGYLAVFPDGYQGYWNACHASGPYTVNRLDIDDPGFMRRLLAYLRVAPGRQPHHGVWRATLLRPRAPRFPRIFGSVNQDISAADEAWWCFQREIDRPR